MLIPDKSLLDGARMFQLQTFGFCKSVLSWKQDQDLEFEKREPAHGPIDLARFI